MLIGLDLTNPYLTVQSTTLGLASEKKVVPNVEADSTITTSIQGLLSNNFC